MPINPCRNPKCEYFNKSLPSSAKMCPMCGEPLGSAFPAAPAPAPTPAYPPPAPTPAPPAYYSPTPAPTPDPPAYYSPTPAPTPAPPAYYSPTPTPIVAPASRPTLKLVHTATGREFYLPGEKGAIGRRSQNNPTVPEIDLTGIPDEGVVSRIHAQIAWDAAQNAYIITDNSSRNGTFLNNAPLRAGTPYRLNPGMSLQLGQDGLVCFTIAFT